MSKTVLFFKMSLSYWFHHKKRLSVFMLSIVLGCIALYSTGMLIRCNKQALLDIILRNIGNYEYIVYDVSQEDAQKIAELEQVDDFGKYYRLGYAIGENGFRSGTACFEDTHSEEIYHMTCEDGRYPRNDTEIAIDIRTARYMGVNPQVGNKISLQLYSYNDKIVLKKEYTICGIYEASDPGILGGWRRYPMGLEENTLEMPGVFLCPGYKDKFGICNVTEFMQCENTEGIKDLINDEFNIPNEQHTSTLGRLFAYSQILGLSQAHDGGILAEKYGGVTFANTVKAMRNGDARLDFYSAVLMPIFSVMIGIIVVISIAGITRNIIRDKQEGFAIMRSLGLENAQLVLYVIVDFMFMTMICILVGMALGAAVHIGMISFLNHQLKLHLATGYECSEVVIAASHDPLIMTAATISISVLITVMIVPLKYISKTPTELFDSQDFGKCKKRGSKTVITKSWKKIVSRRLGMHSHSAAVIAAVVMGAALFGFTYFHALAIKNNGTIEDNKVLYGLEKWDYTAGLSNQSDMYNFNIESRHDRGIDPERLENLANQPFVVDSLGKIVNRSTRVSFKSDELDLETRSIWREFNLRVNTFVHEDDEFEAAMRDAENAMISAIGYGDDEEVFYVPTIGISEKEMSSLDASVIDGKIDIDKLKSGEEVLIAVSQREKDLFAPLFRAGDTIPLSDIKLSDEEEQLDFSRILPADVTEPVFRKNVTTPDGNDVELTSYAFGKRYDIEPKVGAVLVLDDDRTERYLVSAGERHYGINVICTYDEFGAWGLPNRKLTDMSIKVDNNKATVKEMDECWYEAISDAQGISFSSSSDIVDRVISETNKTMSVYYCMMAVLIMLAAVTTAIILYSNIRIKGSKFAIMRACGMSAGQITYIVIKHNMIYPMIGTLFSLIPTAICNRFLRYVTEQIQSGKWPLDRSETGESPWYRELPWGYDLFSYNVPQTLVIIFLVYVILMLAVTLPQMYYISESSITAELEKSDF